MVINVIAAKSSASLSSLCRVPQLWRIDCHHRPSAGPLLPTVHLCLCIRIPLNLHRDGLLADILILNSQLPFLFILKGFPISLHPAEAKEGPGPTVALQTPFT